MLFAAIKSPSLLSFVVSSVHNSLGTEKVLLTTMADDADYVIETADAGASETIPCEAGQIKKGG